ncbi:MAG: tRNA (guanosine(37)-N1)-methyltransferase TrmD [Chloroflexota bacterium]
MEIDVVALFPEMVTAPLRASIPGRIQERGIATIRTHDLREWGLGRHRTVDDAPYGGGAGMVLRPEPVAAAIATLRRPDSIVVLLDPGGRRFDQAAAHELAAAAHLVLICPRYEGIDERVRALVDREVSIGDVVISGGELAALVMIDAVIRLLPGAIDAASTDEESFASGLLEYPQYTRPATFQGVSVPAILTSGDHGAVRRWRHERALERTARLRPDLLVGRRLSVHEAAVVDAAARPAPGEVDPTGIENPTGDG